MARTSARLKDTDSEKVIPLGSPPGNKANKTINLSEPYTVAITLEGVSDLLFHRYDPEVVAETAAAAKNSKQKKTDNIESYVWRNDEGELCLPSEYVRRAIVQAAKFRQDPRSPRKSAMDLVNASVIAATPLATLGKKDWDYLDRRRVLVQRQGITRTRPAIATGWRAEFTFMVLSPEYVDIGFFRDLLTMAGKLVGVGDFRPTYGRFDPVMVEITGNI